MFHLTLVGGAVALLGALIWFILITIIAIILSLTFLTVGIVLIATHPDKQNKSHRGKRKAGWIILSLGLTIVALYLIFIGGICLLGSLI